MCNAAFIVARIALVGWSLLAAFIAVGSLIANPSPFVLLSFSIAALPPWARIRRIQSVVVGLCTPLLVAAYPVILLVQYGDAEGGTSGSTTIAEVAITLGVLSLGLAWLGLGLARIVWSSAHPARTQS